MTSSAEHENPLARPFTGMRLDRAMRHRTDPALIAQLLGDPAARVLAAGRDGVLMSDGAHPALVRAELRSEAQPEPILLGLEDGSARFAVDFEALAEPVRAALTRDARIVSLREAGALLSRSEGGLASYLAALLNWHRSHRFCANCGAVTEVSDGGYARRCPNCGRMHFPRTDPVVIMTVEHHGRLLLGRHPEWPAQRYSVLAGFVAPGESAEEAVVREVREESGIVARDPSFVTSQPWPFPTSLMLGFEARSDGGEPAPRDGELEEVRWFSFDAVDAALQEANPELLLPPSISIARFLIERWVQRRSRSRPRAGKRY
jgi:NAD+ diphosphatase